MSSAATRRVPIDWPPIAPARWPATPSGSRRPPPTPDGPTDGRGEADELRHELGELVVLIDIAATYEAQADALADEGAATRPDDADRRLGRLPGSVDVAQEPSTSTPAAGTYAAERRARAVATARRAADRAVGSASAAPRGPLPKDPHVEERAPLSAPATRPADGSVDAGATHELAELDRRLEHLDRVAEDLLHSFAHLRARLAAGVEGAPA